MEKVATFFPELIITSAKYRVEALNAPNIALVQYKFTSWYCATSFYLDVDIARVQYQLIFVLYSCNIHYIFIQI